MFVFVYCTLVFIKIKFLLHIKGFIFMNYSSHRNNVQKHLEKLQTELTSVDRRQ